MPTTETRRRGRRLELRTTLDERELIDRAVSVMETDRTKFVVGNVVEAATRALAAETSSRRSRLRRFSPQ
jgi:uncharacterized protein (DUF1778 family)